MPRIAFVLTGIVLLVMLTGCSSSSVETPVVPVETSRISDDAANHQLWGYFQFTVDPSARTLDVIPLRSSAIHLNALPFLEPPPMANLTLENLSFNGNIIEVDIVLRHPFLGLTQFTGFDVNGILITNGSVIGFTDPDIRITGDDDTRLLNPDGYSRWWNPVEFPVNDGTIFSYTDGLLGSPDSQVDFNSTLNAYKYFCDDLAEPDSSLDLINLENRGMFSAGQQNVRKYFIEVGGNGLVFNYAIDASWANPDGQPPWNVPDDFPPNANRPEAYRIKVTETENSLYYVDDSNSGGALGLLVYIYDWTGPELNTVSVESLSAFGQVTSATPIGNGPGYATYEFIISDASPVTSGEIDILISVIDPSTGYQGLLPGKNVTSYFVDTTTVSTDPPQQNDLGDWLISQGNIGHTGYTGRYGPSEIHSAPTFQSDYAPDTGNALSVFLNDDTAFFSYAWVLADIWFPTIAVDLVTGETIWSVAFHEEQDYYTQPKGISDDGTIVLVCETLSNAGQYAGYIAGLDADDGSVVWDWTGDHRILVDSYATLDLEGNFIIAEKDVGYHSVDAYTGEINWTAPGSPGYCTPATGPDGTIYGYFSGALHAFDPATGAENWSVFPSGGFGNFGVTVSDDGKIIVAGNDGVFCFTDGGSEAVEVWQQDYTYCPYGSASIAPNGDIYYVDHDVPNQGHLRQLDPDTGETLNMSEIIGQAGTRPVVGEDGLVYVNSRETFRVFNPDCTELWSYNGGGFPSWFCAPALGEDGTIYSSKKETGLCGWKDG